MEQIGLSQEYGNALLTVLQQISNGLVGTQKSLEDLSSEHNKLKSDFNNLQKEYLDYQVRAHREYGDLMNILTKSISHFAHSPYSVHTEHPVALASHDHIFPLGTRQDNTRYPRFIRKCETLFNRKIRAVDLGCAGGGLVLDFLMAGHQAMGLEGSTYPQANQLAQWRWLENRLFTCDITKPFQISDSSIPGEAKFEIITAWEVLEHLHEEQLTTFFANVKKHLRDDGYFCASVATFECNDPETGAVWHVTLKPQQWWEAKCQEAGLTLVTGAFQTYDFPRGSGNGCHDWNHETQPHMGFHIVAKAG